MDPSVTQCLHTLAFTAQGAVAQRHKAVPPSVFFLFIFFIFLYLLIHLFWFVLFKYTLFNISTKFYHVNVPDLVIQANFQLQPSISMSKW